MTAENADKDQAWLGLAEMLRIAGISKLVLHAWERRYGLAPAGRNEAGLRFYTREQAEHLRLLKACSDAGHRIGTLAGLSAEALARLEESHRSRLGLVPLIEALQALDGEALREALMARAGTAGPERFVRDTALPLLLEIGNLRASGTVTAAAEHIAATKINRIVGTMLDACPPPPADAPRLVITTPESEQREIGALAGALLARLHGWNALYLGPDLPAADIVLAARNRHAGLVCLTAHSAKAKLLDSHLSALRAALPADTAIWIGGAAYAGRPAPDGVRFLADVDAYIDALREGLAPLAKAV